ncbi:MAG: hypothetical protein ACOCVF_01700 [bacterium]
MTNTKEYQLGEFKFVGAINEDFNQKIAIDSSKDLLRENDIRTIVDVTQIFDDERQNIDTFRIYGELEYFSQLNGIPKDYTSIVDFFIPYTGTSAKNIFDDFEFYIVKPATGFTETPSGTFANGYIRNFEVLSSLDNVDIYPIGFANNIFGERQYSFNFNIDFNIKDDVDGLGFPITELYLYAQYNPQTNGNNNAETMQRYQFVAGAFSSFTPVTLFPGDIITGDRITFDLENYQQIIEENARYLISTPVTSQVVDGTNVSSLQWIYNPFTPIQLKVFSNEVSRVNSGNTSYDEVQRIPEYALPLDNDGNFVWRDLLDKGFIDPLTGEGVNYPFVNKRHYLFNNYIISITPNLSHTPTNKVFKDIIFESNELINTSPTSNLNNIGKLCS